MNTHQDFSRNRRFLKQVHRWKVLGCRKP